MVRIAFAPQTFTCVTIKREYVTLAWKVGLDRPAIFYANVEMEPVTKYRELANVQRDFMELTVKIFAPWVGMDTIARKSALASIIRIARQIRENASVPMVFMERIASTNVR